MKDCMKGLERYSPIVKAIREKKLSKNVNKCV